MTLTDSDLDRIEDRVREAGMDPLTTPFDELADWLQLAAGRTAPRAVAEDVARALKVRALREAAA